MRRALFASLSFVAGCYTVGPGTSGYENDEIACADARDNDQDGRIDCMDTDCLMRGFCGEQIPIVPNLGPENTFDLCSDGIDNDDDGAFDCGDRVCQSIMELCCVTEIDDASCDDNVDNDGNGFTDCGDFSCRNNPFVSVCTTECGPGGCTEDPASLAACSDGIDDDGDRRTDCNDTDCSCTSICNADCAGPENTEERCRDGVSNDGDPYVDCNDRDCDPICCTGTGAPETDVATCTNGVDDDCNGYQDCEDRSCYDSTVSPPGGAAVAECQARSETSLATCSDGIDNDENDFTDCNDFSCSRSPDPEVVAHCRAVTETDFENCSDQRDNDHNSFVDCADFSCEFVRMGLGIELCQTADECTGGTCENGFCVRSCAAGETCPAGTQCDPINDICIQPCLSNAECDLGESCYRGYCLALAAPCTESLYFDDSTTLQSYDGSTRGDATEQEQIAMSVAACTDGVDNDDDGFVDCEDWECNYNPRVVDADGNPLCQSAGGRTCIFGSFAGQRCDTDAECGGLTGACELSGPADIPLVCP